MNLLQSVWKKWLAVAKVIGHFQSQIILTFFYLVILLPLGFAFRIFADPLHLQVKKGARTNFVPWNHPKETLDEARKQY